MRLFGHLVRAKVTQSEIVWTPGESEGTQSVRLFGHLVRAKVTQSEIVWSPGESEGNTEV